MPLPEPAVEAVGDVVERVREQMRHARPDDREVRWVRLTGLHVTLRFLGATPSDRVVALERAIQAARAAVEGPFEVELGPGGSFPETGRPRVLWLSIRHGADRLVALAAGLGQALELEGWASESRPFRPHLSLARCDGVRAGGATARALADATRDTRIGWRAERLVLFESRTGGGGGARYVPLAETALTGPTGHDVA